MKQLNPVIELVKVSKSFGSNQVLKRINFKAYPGEVHALLGENGAGKSTMMKIISGIHQHSSGELRINGKSVSLKSPKDAEKQGVSIVHQELSLIQELSVAQNIYGNRIPTNKMGFIHWKKANQMAQEVLDYIGVEICAKEKVKNLTVGKQQLVEIAKAVSIGAKVLIMDEPSSSLSETDVKLLYSVVNRLKKQNVTMVFISHKLDEVFDIAEQVSVLRDGDLVSNYLVQETDKAALIRDMVGRNIDSIYPEKNSSHIGEEVLSVNQISKKGEFNNVSFSTYEGEILGFAGLVGSGRTEVARAIFGAEAINSGEILLKGQSINFKHPSEAIDAGVMYLTEDRKELGLFLDMSIQENVVSASLKNFCNKLNFLKMDKIDDAGALAISNFKIKAENENVIVDTLSGGNQQKVLFAKCLQKRPNLLIVDEPTRGVDVGSKSSLHHQLRDLANSGMSIIVISSELPEVLGISDRIAVFKEGEIQRFFPSDTSQEEIMKYAAV